MSHSIKVGDQVVKGGNAYIVCEVDGNVIGLRRLSGSFYQYTHVDNVHVQLELDLASSSPAADQGPALGLAAPAGLAVGGTRSFRVHRVIRAPRGRWVAMVHDHVAISVRDQAERRA